MPGSVPYTSTLALTNVTLPYIKEITLNDNILTSKTIRSGINVSNGNVNHKGVSETFNLEYTSLV